MLCLVNNNNKATRVGSRPWMFGRRITGAGNRWIDRFSVFSLNAISDIEPRTHVWNLVAASTLTDSPIFFSRCSSSYFLLAIYYWSVWSDNEDKKEKKKEKKKKRAKRLLYNYILLRLTKLPLSRRVVYFTLSRYDSVTPSYPNFIYHWR